jgi:hypothetical protein
MIPLLFTKNCLNKTNNLVGLLFGLESKLNEINRSATGEETDLFIFFMRIVLCKERGICQADRSILWARL